jgi:hypothetical protein
MKTQNTKEEEKGKSAKRNGNTLQEVINSTNLPASIGSAFKAPIKPRGKGGAALKKQVSQEENSYSQYSDSDDDYGEEAGEYSPGAN